jgi:hypothetical protein
MGIFETSFRSVNMTNPKPKKVNSKKNSPRKSLKTFRDFNFITPEVADCMFDDDIIREAKDEANQTNEWYNEKNDITYTELQYIC